MTFREIDDRLLELVDPETGEIKDIQAFDDLQMERDKKAEGMALWVLDLRDEADAIQEEIKRLTDRKAAVNRKMDSLKRYLQIVLDNKPMKTPLISVSYRNTSAVEISDDEAVIRWAEKFGQEDNVLSYLPPVISKTEVKKLIQDGEKIPGVSLVEHTSTIIR